MIKDKRIRKLVETMVQDLSSEKNERNLKLLKALPRPQAVAALSFYLKLAKANLGKTTLTIESAVSLSTQQIKQITDSVKEKYSVTSVKTEVKGSLLGGLRVKIGDVVFDDSVAQRISQLRSTING